MTGSMLPRVNEAVKWPNNIVTVDPRGLPQPSVASAVVWTGSDVLPCIHMHRSGVWKYSPKLSILYLDWDVTRTPKPTVVNQIQGERDGPQPKLLPSLQEIQEVCGQRARRRVWTKSNVVEMPVIKPLLFLKPKSTQSSTSEPEELNQDCSD